MIFKQWQAVKNRAKTQTRRLVKEGDFAANTHGRAVPDDVWGNRIDTVYDDNGRMRWQVGRTYAIQPGRGKNAIGRIRITKIKRERLQDISRPDCLAEGVIEIPNQLGTPWYRSVGGEWKTARGAFAELWDSIHKKPGTRWPDNPEVWVLVFEG